MRLAPKAAEPFMMSRRHAGAEHPDAGGEVRHICPKDPLALGVIERHAIGHDVDTSGIDPAYSEVGVADTDTRLARRYYGRCLQKEVGDVLPKVRL